MQTIELHFSLTMCVQNLHTIQPLFITNVETAA
jgi:hypothetical protein